MLLLVFLLLSITVYSLPKLYAVGCVDDIDDLSLKLAVLIRPVSMSGI